MAVRPATFTQAVGGQTRNTTDCLFEGVDMHLFPLENIEGKYRVGAAGATEGKRRVGAAEVAEIDAWRGN